MTSVLKPITQLDQISNPTELVPNRRAILEAFARTRYLFADIINHHDFPKQKNATTIFDIPTYEYLPDEYRGLEKGRKLQFIKDILNLNDGLEVNNNRIVSEYIQGITKKIVLTIKDVFHYSFPKVIINKIESCDSLESLFEFMEGSWTQALSPDEKLMHCSTINLIFALHMLERIDRKKIGELLDFYLEEFKKFPGAKEIVIHPNGKELTLKIPVDGELILIGFKADQKTDVAILEKYFRKREYIDPQMMQDLARFEVKINATGKLLRDTKVLMVDFIRGFFVGRIYVEENHINPEDHLFEASGGRKGMDYSYSGERNIENIQITGKPNKKAPKVEGLKNIEIQIVYSESDFNAGQTLQGRTMYNKKRLQSAFSRFLRKGTGIIRVNGLKYVIEEYKGGRRPGEVVKDMSANQLLLQLIKDNVLIPLNLRDEAGNICYAVADIFNTGKELFENPPLSIFDGTNRREHQALEAQVLTEFARASIERSTMRD